MVELVTLINKGWKKAERRGPLQVLSLILHHLTTISLLWQTPLFLVLLLNYIILSALSCPVLWLKIPPSINKSLSSLMGNFKEKQYHTVLQQKYNLEHTSFSSPPQVSRCCNLQPLFHFWWDSAHNQTIPSSVWINTIFQQKFQMLRIFFPMWLVLQYGFLLLPMSHNISFSLS